MSFKCTICGKKPVAGRSVSHSRKTTNRVFKPNLRRQRIVLEGKVQKVYVCTACIRSGRIKKAV